MGFLHKIFVSALCKGILLGIFFSIGVQATPNFKLLAAGTIPNKQKFQKTKMGGFSGMWRDPASGHYFAVSDDRGQVNEPRFYEMQITRQDRQLKIEALKVSILKRSKEKSYKLPSIIDSEGIAPLPWGNLLISSEGDQNHRPRTPPALIEVKRTGEAIREFSFPSEFYAEPIGRQGRGIQNNRGMEGLTSTASGAIFGILEAPLTQDLALEAPLREGVRLVKWEMTDPFIIKPTQQWFYPLGKSMGSEVVVDKGISEILALSETEFLVLERALTLSLKGASFDCRLFYIDLNKSKNIEGAEWPFLEKTEVLNLADLLNRDGFQLNMDNFEAMAWGPEDKSGAKSLLIVSDDNFSKHQSNLFLWLEMTGKFGP